MQNAIAEWKDAARQLGRDVPSPAALGQWRQRAPRSLHEKLKIIAACEGVSLNAFVTSVLAEAVGKKSVWCGEFEVPIGAAASSSWEFQIQSRYSNQ